MWTEAGSIRAPLVINGLATQVAYPALVGQSIPEVVE